MVTNGVENRVDVFTREQVQKFHISRTDNRTVKLQI